MSNKHAMIRHIETDHFGRTLHREEQHFYDENVLNAEFETLEWSSAIELEWANKDAEAIEPGKSLPRGCTSYVFRENKEPGFNRGYAPTIFVYAAGILYRTYTWQVVFFDDANKEVFVAPWETEARAQAEFDRDVNRYGFSA